MPARATIRRTRYGLGSMVLVLAVAACCVIAGVLGSRYHLRWDVTATRQHTLSPRTLAILNGIKDQRTIVVSADMSRLDRRSAGAMSDLLDEFARRAPSLAVVWIDTGSPTGRAEFDDLIQRLAEADDAGLASQRQSLIDLADGMEDLAESMLGVSDCMKALGAAFGEGSTQATDLERQAGVVRTLPARLEPAVSAVRSAADHRIGGALLPAVDQAVDASRGPVAEFGQAMRAIAEFAQSVDAGSGSNASAIRSAARTLAETAGARMDQAARITDALARMRPSDPLIVARTLEATDAVLITGAAGTLAIDFASLFPAIDVAASSSPSAADQVFVGEQLICTALSALDQARAPIVVFVHAEDATIVDTRGGPTALGRAVFGRIFERMRLARIEAYEWPIAKEPLRPDIRAIDPSGERPVVWIVLAPPTPIGAEARGPSGLAERNARVAKLGAAAGALVIEGQNVLFSLDASDLPAIGEVDPIAASLASLGVTVDTGHPLLRRESSPAGQVTYSYMIARSADDDHAVSDAIAGLAVALPWASPMTISNPLPEGVRAWALLRAAPDSAIWGESQWLALRGLEARRRMDPLNPPALTDPPRADAGRDLVDSPPEGWTLAVAIERAGGSGSAPQRVLAVASPAWMHNTFAEAWQSVGGRRALRFPGNAEFFEAAVQWLAGRDELIAAGPQSRDVPRIEAISPSALAMLRWVVIAAPALIVLLLGAMLRILRG